MRRPWCAPRRTTRGPPARASRPRRLRRPGRPARRPSCATIAIVTRGWPATRAAGGHARGGAAGRPPSTSRGSGRFRGRGGMGQLTDIDDLTARRAAATVVRPPDLGPGSMVGEWEIESELAAGGMGIVYAVRHPIIGKRAALKLLRPELARDAEVVRRFVAEATAVNTINHPNIVDVFGFGCHSDGRHYCVMELLSGESLADRLEREVQLPLADAMPILRDIADAIDAAHALGVVHRDLKPDNVFLTDGGTVKVLDFGIAKLVEQQRTATQPGAILGTPLTMAPEQCRGDDVDHRADVYAFGALVYRVLLGRYPFEADDVHALLLHHVSDDPPPPSALGASARLDGPLLRALAKDPAARYDSLGELLDDIERAVSSRPEVVADAIGYETGDVPAIDDARGPSRRVRCVAYAPAADAVATDGEGGAIDVWSLDGQRSVRLEGHAGDVTHVAYSPTGDLIASAALDLQIRVWRTNGSLMHVLRGHRARITALRFSEDGTRILSGAEDGAIRVWEIGTAREWVYKGHRGAVRAVVASPTDVRIASVGDDRTARVWDDSRGGRWVLRADRLGLRTVAFSPDGCRLAAAGYDGVLLEWNLTEPYDIARRSVRRRTGHRGAISHVAYSPDGEWLASAGADGTVRLWPRDHRPPRVLSGHGRRVRRVAFSPDGRYLASAGIDCCVRLWDVRSGRCEDIVGLEHPTSWVTFSPDGEHLLSCSSPRSVVVTRVPRRRTVRLAQAPIRRARRTSSAGAYVLAAGLVAAAAAAAALMWT
ncbi:MAG: hypothetical protein D6689_16360 [Deltaproteobacteria bacterium]|nr:MAG: hypothetical protein D6689_16360 [Deltaproteobacteria bacterium]